MDKLGLTPPTNIGEFMEYLRVMAEDDPDGNGVDDTYAMLVDKGLWDQLSAFFWMFKAYPTTWYEASDGSLIYGAVQPEMKEPLALLQKMYSDGWLDPEFTVKDYTKATEIVAAGQCGLVLGPHWSTHISLNRSQENDPNADWIVAELPVDNNGEPTRVKLDFGLQHAICVNTNYKHPEAAIKMLNLYNQLMFGDDGDYAYYCSPFIDGQMVADLFTLAPITALYPQMDVDNVNKSMPAYSGAVDPDSLQGASRVFYDNSMAEWTWWRMFGPDRSAGIIMSMIYKNTDVYVRDNLFNGAPTTTMVDRWAQMVELTNTTITKIIVGELNASSDFDAFVNDWMNMGGAKVTEEVSEWYRANAKN
jgi:putative aldouronate transport system substrate-binding protein